ncbi:hypothetical protein SODALDRAFT_328359 [Sodiomyces alkalinus F11]|uniref:Mitotic checkpoint regulator, MAD2B-interacting-domain-containing protein n=1 Tax=Sodiomyces alkalinus (strain CBS 110278 / VKM F-3762 / F11) TaxID=1314773 RepID=A0A3N2PNH3_SODAK|nr:hypothetical protein SODALDRAFT_328359 [Sodiomyces alkalinus F11]ROT35980.1 hypothetical protein SODALDRAFT_328359 [Sodiomyces alkalinus F11]
MGLVDYSESDSEPEVTNESAPKPTTKTTAAPYTTNTTTTKKPFQKVVDRSNPGKIRVNLPQLKGDDEPASTSDEPPAKRVKTGGGGGLFGGMNSFLPPPKNTGAKKAIAASTNTSRPPFQLKTSSEAGFRRESPQEAGVDVQGAAPGTGGSGLMLPPPRATTSQPSIPDGMKAEEDVKLVGKPMMFRPLSVARAKKKGPKKLPTAPPSAPAGSESTVQQPKPVPEVAAPPPPKKMSLFSIASEPEPEEPAAATETNGAYEPLFEPDNVATSYDSYAADTAGQGTYPVPATAPNPADPTSLGVVADDLNLSAAERRELFGRSGAPGPSASTSRVINFDMEREYQHNEELRASGEQQIHRPIRGITPGKHNLRQLVNAVQSQREALEESFAKGKNIRKEASGRYGW